MLAWEMNIKFASFPSSSNPSAYGKIGKTPISWWIKLINGGNGFASPKTSDYILIQILGKGSSPSSGVLKWI